MADKRPVIKEFAADVAAEWVRAVPEAKAAAQDVAAYAKRWVSPLVGIGPVHEDTLRAARGAVVMYASRRAAMEADVVDQRIGDTIVRLLGAAVAVLA